MFWVLRNGHYIRVILNIDPCWTKTDIYKGGNLYAKFISEGYSESEASSLAAASIWKSKWVGTVYDKKTETILNGQTKS
jgi:hypothetical protein